MPPSLAFPYPPPSPSSTRLLNQDQTHKLYNGMWDCLVKVYRAEGLRGFFKGLPAHYARLGPHTVLTFTIWEQLKSMNLTRFVD